MSDRETEGVMHWTCPSCHLQWLDEGRGFFPQRFSTCVGCGAEACEPDDARPGWCRPRVPLPDAAADLVAGGSGENQGG